MDLNTSLENAGRVYKMYATRLQKLGISTLEDFLYHIPHRYEDFSHVTLIKDAIPGDLVTIKGNVTQIKNVYTRNHKNIQQGIISDATGDLHIMWFNQSFITRVLHIGDTVALAGRVEIQGIKRQMLSPEYEVLTGENGLHTGRLVPVYPETKGVSSKWLRRQIDSILSSYKNSITDYMPNSILSDLKLLPLVDAIEKIHYPSSFDEAGIAKERLAFDEIFLTQAAAAMRKEEWQEEKKASAFQLQPFEKHIQEFWEKLPFDLTNSQRKVINEIFSDTQKDTPMNRLLVGDVGSGKTVVAAAAMYLAYLNGFQSMIMAPTEILAEQHFRTLSKLLEPLGVKIELRTGSTSKLHPIPFNLSPNIFIGTHALLNNKVQPEHLGFIVIDEQHRFGVNQRGLLKSKGNNPHLLTMTATPIPRTVALTVYGDLDLSVIDEMPVNRKKITTWFVPTQKRAGAYEWIQKQINEGDQVFIVCPFIEVSESMSSVKAATEEFEKLKGIFSKNHVGMLHGKMKSTEKDAILSDFRNKKIDILVSTPVVEVGIDIPNATIMMIEGADRFGLAQLHQLRGRVGRGEKQSYCLLLTESTSEKIHERLKMLTTTESGQELAELDLRLRGPGDMYGVSQSGAPDLKVASYSDVALIEKSKAAVEKIIPEIEHYPLLKAKIDIINQHLHINPD